MRPLPFTIEASCGDARAGVMQMARGLVQTPVFMPVGTQGAIRSLPPSWIRDTGSQIILANTYHLSQRPGAHVVEKHGGLHRMMGVDLPILTDSGGFQVFSLDKSDVTEEGVTFAFELDGRKTVLSPELSMGVQQQLGADIAMVFDECLPFGADEARTAMSIERTARWEARCKAAHHRTDQSLFGIVQGATFPEQRRKSAQMITEIGFDGYAVGGLAVGEGHDIMCQVLDATTPHLPVDSARYLMGVGRPIDLVEGVARGVDMFDCVIPTRHARSGVFYTSTGRLRITDRRYRNDYFPLDASCSCVTCRTFTRAYLHHLFRVGEILGATLATVHNLTFWSWFMARMRESIVEGRFEQFRRATHESWPADRGPQPVAGGGGDTYDGPDDERSPGPARRPVSRDRRGPKGGRRRS